MGQKRITQWSEDSGFVRVEVVGENEAEGRMRFRRTLVMRASMVGCRTQAGVPVPLGGRGPSGRRCQCGLDQPQGLTHSTLGPNSTNDSPRPPPSLPFPVQCQTTTPRFEKGEVHFPGCRKSAIAEDRRSSTTWKPCRFSKLELAHELPLGCGLDSQLKQVRPLSYLVERYREGRVSRISHKFCKATKC